MQAQRHAVACYTSRAKTHVSGGLTCDGGTVLLMLRLDGGSVTKQTEEGLDLDALTGIVTAPPSSHQGKRDWITFIFPPGHMSTSKFTN